jgi:hypothetical protein
VYYFVPGDNTTSPIKYILADIEHNVTKMADNKGITIYIHHDTDKSATYFSGSEATSEVSNESPMPNRGQVLQEQAEQAELDKMPPLIPNEPVGRRAESLSTTNSEGDLRSPEEFGKVASPPEEFGQRADSIVTADSEGDRMIPDDFSYNTSVNSNSNPIYPESITTNKTTPQPDDFSYNTSVNSISNPIYPESVSTQEQTHIPIAIPFEESNEINEAFSIALNMGSSMMMDKGTMAF